MADSARAEVTQKTHICLILLPPCTMFCYKVTPEYGAEVVFLSHKRGNYNLIFSIVCCHPAACFVIIRRLCIYTVMLRGTVSKLPIFEITLCIFYYKVTPSGPSSGSWACSSPAGPLRASALAGTFSSSPSKLASMD